MPRLRPALAVLLPVLAGAAAAAGRIVLDFDLHTPRDFGYLVGDVVETRVEFEVAAPYTLVDESLPEQQRIDRFLQFDAPVLESEETLAGTRYVLHLRYRLLGAPLEVTYLETPAFTLDVASERGELALAVPAWRFSAGPMVVPEDPVAGASVTLQPPQPPPLLPLRMRWTTLALLGAAIAVVLGFLAFAHLRLPWLVRANGPFARALHDLRRLRGDGEAASVQRRALARVHRAFDETAGRTLFESDLPGFLSEHPRFAPLGEAIAGFYAGSRSVFWLPRGDASTAPDLGALRRLCLACRDAERGLS